MDIHNALRFCQKQRFFLFYFSHTRKSPPLLFLAAY